MVNNEHANTGI